VVLQRQTAQVSRSSRVPIDASIPGGYDGLWCARNINMGQVVRIFRILLCWSLSLTLPLCLNAADLPVAILHAQSGVWVNGKQVPDSTAIFAGDTLQTQAGAIASLDSDGSTILLAPESVATFQNSFLTLDHGSVSVGTGRQFRVKVRCLNVVPVRAEWTQYEVTDVSGKIDVAARKNDVNIDHDAGHTKPSQPDASSPQSNEATVREGEEKSHDESEACGAPERPGAAGSTLNAKWIYTGAGIAGGIILLLLLGGGGGTKPSVSPSSP
jgi:hypothetical protein